MDIINAVLDSKREMLAVLKELFDLYTLLPVGSKTERQRVSDKMTEVRQIMIPVYDFIIRQKIADEEYITSISKFKHILTELDAASSLVNIFMSFQKINSCRMYLIMNPPKSDDLIWKDFSEHFQFETERAHEQINALHQLWSITRSSPRKLNIDKITQEYSSLISVVKSAASWYKQYTFQSEYITGGKAALHEINCQNAQCTLTDYAFKLYDHLTGVENQQLESLLTSIYLGLALTTDVLHGLKSLTY